MDFRDKDGHPLPNWTDPESAFEAWKECTAGRPCDYTGLSYDKLRGGSGIQWPCNAEHPDGTERLYTDGEFSAAPDYCEAYGKDLITGAPLQPDEYRSLNPFGKAIIKAAQYVPPHERTSSEFPFALTTGRTVYHFHTRTKTARAQQLQRAAPDVWVEVSERDARRLGIEEGDFVEVSTPRGCVVGAARISGIRDGVLFVPFHYGYWDTGDKAHHRAGNEMTLTDWDPVSKQPTFKTAAARLRKVRGAQPDRNGAGYAPTTAASAPVNGSVPATEGGPLAGVTEVVSTGS
jgi:anaerobic selenocysteine-containing dehydrogenase